MHNFARRCAARRRHLLAAEGAEVLALGLGGRPTRELGLDHPLLELCSTVLRQREQRGARVISCGVWRLFVRAVIADWPVNEQLHCAPRERCKQTAAQGSTVKRNRARNTPSLPPPPSPSPTPSVTCVISKRASAGSAWNCATATAAAALSPGRRRRRRGGGLISCDQA